MSAPTRRLRDVVLMERDGHWIVNGEENHWPVTGAYEVKDEEITAWREYIDPKSQA
jgi:limonene-1,2-epoxide hydrolase